ncbi:FHA domain-containing protein [Streptomyces sp. FXJ1.4098]|nr:FHA domain-containing protein [Streptomyces sp. FXJ1.4098]
MRIVYADGKTEREMELRVGRPNATLADLAATLDIPASGLSIDGRTAPPETGLGESGLAHGSRVARAGWGSAGGPRVAVAVLRVVGGLEAGRSVPLRVGRTVIGRGAEADVRVVATGVSRLHAALEISADGQVHITDLGTVNGTDVCGERISKAVRLQPEDLVSLGGEVMVRVLPQDRLGPVQRVNPVREVGPGGTLPFNRPPRGGRPGDPPRIPTPSSPPSANKAPFSIASMLGPLVMAGAIVGMTGDVRYAAIAALTPLMFVGNFFEERLRGRFTFRRGMRDHTAKVKEFEQAVAARHAAEIRTRRAAHPDPRRWSTARPLRGSPCGNGARAPRTSSRRWSAPPTCPGTRRLTPTPRSPLRRWRTSWARAAYCHRCRSWSGCRPVRRWGSRGTAGRPSASPGPCCARRWWGADRPM